MRKQKPGKPIETIFGLVYDTATLSKSKSMRLFDYVATFPNVVLMTFSENKEAHIRWFGIKREGYKPTDGGPERPRLPITINGRFIEKTEMPENYTVADAEYIRLLNTPTNLYIGHEADAELGWDVVQKTVAQNYRLDIILKDSAVPHGSEVDLHRFTGYARNAEFYRPVYDSPKEKSRQEPDTRTTLYWNPYVAPDSDGAVSFEFYSGDSDAPQYEITVEGVTLDGQPCRYRAPL